MILFLIIWILKMINPTEAQIEANFSQLSDPEAIKTFLSLDIFSFFDLMPKLHRGLIFIAAGVEVFLWINAIIRFLPRYISNRIKRAKNKPINDVEIYKAIKYKLDNNLPLTRKEEKILSEITKK
ncbi:Uncharacterised protein (plasmid) [Mesomycoplasma conjunctivae]|nr:Uncharacterised protein [Mesomycoplasma conjunctivae]VEU66658.1 Uncharacterised protein [Mesomycoplasma conjunctivae]